MDPESVSRDADRWGDRRSLASGETDNIKAMDRAKTRRLWWMLGTLCGLLILGVVFCLVRPVVISSLSNSCRAARQAEDWQQLDVLAGRWCMWEWDKAVPLIYRAEAANRTGRYERAVELLHELPDDDPMTPPALMECSEILFGPLNRATEAVETLERAVELDPKYIEARRRLIYFYAYTLQRRKMVDFAYDSIQQDCDLPETYVYILLQDSLSFSNAYEENTRWFQGDPDEELFLVARAIHRIRSRGLDERQDPTEGAKNQEEPPLHKQVAAEYSAKFPQNLELLAYYLQLSSTAGEVDEVARLLARAPAEAAYDNRFWRYMGWLHAARGELHQAKESYEKALRLNCYDHISRHQLAGVERKFKRPERVEALEELVREGKALRRAILELDNVARVPPVLLRRMALYAEVCGDELAAVQLNHRIEQWSDEWSRDPIRVTPDLDVKAR